MSLTKHHRHVFPEWVSVAMQLCDEPTPPQSTVSCDIPTFHVPVQPVRWSVPSVTAPLVKSPLMSRVTVPLSADPVPPCETS
jgi:hypothetical protein